MNKKTIAILYIIAVILGVIGGGLAAAGAASVVNATNAGSTITTATFGATYFIGIAVAGVASIFGLIAWIGALIATGRLGRWGWFVVVLLLSGLGILIYLIAGPSIASLSFPSDQPQRAY